MNHAELSAHIRPFNTNTDAPVGMVGQAAMIGNLNNFQLMMLVTLTAIPLLLLLRKPKAAAAADRQTAVME